MSDGTASLFFKLHNLFWMFSLYAKWFLKAPKICNVFLHMAVKKQFCMIIIFEHLVFPFVFTDTIF